MKLDLHQSEDHNSHNEKENSRKTVFSPRRKCLHWVITMLFPYKTRPSPVWAMASIKCSLFLKTHGIELRVSDFHVGRCCQSVNIHKNIRIIIAVRKLTWGDEQEREVKEDDFYDCQTKTLKYGIWTENKTLIKRCPCKRLEEEHNREKKQQMKFWTSLVRNEASTVQGTERNGGSDCLSSQSCLARESKGGALLMISSIWRELHFYSLHHPWTLITSQEGEVSSLGMTNGT